MRMVSSIRTCSAVAATALACSTAYAADYSVPISDAPLRGSEEFKVGQPVYPRWEGFYFGAQAGMAFENADLSGATSPQLTTILQNTQQASDVAGWTVLGKGSTSTPSFGAFLGYNFQWDQLVASFEANYNRLNTKAISQTGTMGPIIAADGYTFTATGSASVAITDVVTLRGRFGYAIDRIMPYAFIGAALGRANVSRTSQFTQVLNNGVNITGSLTNNPLTESRSGAFVYGVAFGLGVEATILPNMFLRAEYEYVQFAPIYDMKVNVSSGRVGLGLKF